MRGLLMALISLDFPGHAAGYERAHARFSTNPAKSTTRKATTGKTV